MAKPISIDLRRRVCAAISEGLSCREAAVRFKVSASSAIRWQAQMRATARPLLQNSPACSPRGVPFGNMFPKGLKSEAARNHRAGCQPDHSGA